MVPAPDLLIKYYKRALLVIGEITEIPVEKGAKPVKIDDTNTDIFQCSSCNANLPVSVTVRTITCEFCGSLNYLPESLFHKLANEKTKDWYIIFDSTLDYGKD